MRICSTRPDGQPASRPPRSSRRSSRRTSSPPPARSALAGASADQRFEYPDHVQGAALEGRGVREDRRPPQRRRLVRLPLRRRPRPARLGELRDGRLAQRQARRRRRSTSSPTPTPSTSSRRSAPDGPGGPELPRRPGVSGSPTTRPSTSARTSPRWGTLIEAFLLVLIVVFVFLQGFRATAIPMIAIPVSLVATFGMMAVFGFSINTLTLCGLVLAIGLVVDDAIIVVENIEKFLERGMRPLEATRAAMAEITAPIVTIGLVLAAVFVPVAFVPGLTGRLYNQFALTIVFSFLFSAFNSLTFTPAIARLLLKPKHGETKFPFRWFNRGLKWVENSYDSFLDFRGPLLVGDRPAVARPAGPDRMADLRAPQGVHPDGGPGLPDRHRADARRHHPGAHQPGRPAGRPDRRRAPRRPRRADPRRLQRHQRDQPDRHRHRVRHPRGLAPPDRAPGCGPPAWRRTSSAGSPSRSSRRGRRSSNRRRSRASAPPAASTS